MYPKKENFLLSIHKKKKTVLTTNNHLLKYHQINHTVRKIALFKKIRVFENND